MYDVELALFCSWGFCFLLSERFGFKRFVDLIDQGSGNYDSLRPGQGLAGSMEGLRRRKKHFKHFSHAMSSDSHKP